MFPLAKCYRSSVTIILFVLFLFYNVPARLHSRLLCLHASLSVWKKKWEKSKMIQERRSPAPARSIVHRNVPRHIGWVTRILCNYLLHEHFFVLPITTNWTIASAWFLLLQGSAHRFRYERIYNEFKAARSRACCCHTASIWLFLHRYISQSRLFIVLLGEALSLCRCVAASLRRRVAAWLRVAVANAKWRRALARENKKFNERVPNMFTVAPPVPPTK